MKILITGGSGFLGVRLCQHLGKRHQIVAPTHSDLDISDAKSALLYIERVRPDAVLHCAAISSTAEAQRCPELSEAVNVGGTLNVAVACKSVGAKLLIMSSDQVYEGIATSDPLSEDAPLCPSRIYGQHKLKAETLVRELLPSAVGLRLTWMYDDPNSPLRLNQNILVAMRQACLYQTSIRACTREYRGLTNVWHVVENIEKALSLPGGIYNFGSENLLNSYETYLRFAQLTNTPQQLIVADSTWQRNLSMSIERVRTFAIDFPKTI